MACEEALDASPFCSDNQGSEKAAGKDLKQSRMMFARDFVHLLQRNGFVRLRGHGISATNISQVFQAVGIQSSHNVEALAIVRNDEQIAQNLLRSTTAEKARAALQWRRDTSSGIHTVPH